MSETVAVAVVGVAGTILGGVIGAVVAYWLNERAAANREQRTEGRQRESVRLVVSLEIDHNLRLFCAYWANLKSPEAVDALTRERDEYLSWSDELEASHWANRLVDLLPPSWVRRSWDSLAGSVASALDATEIAAVNRFFSNLDTIAELRQQLVAPAAEEVRHESFRDALGREYTTTVIPWRFNKMAPDVWSQCETIAQELIENGNPLNPHVGKTCP